MPDRWCVVLANPDINRDPTQVKPLAMAIQQATGAIPYDATRRARDARGILMEDLSAAQAEALVGELAALGVDAGLADAAVLPDVDRPERVRAVQVETEGLDVQTGYVERFERLPWSQIQLVNVCRVVELQTKAVRQETRRGKRSTFSPGNMFARAVGGRLGASLHRSFSPSARSKQWTHKLSPDEHYVADIQTAAPPRILRVRSNDCNYQYLADRRQERAEWNFHTMLSDVATLGESVLIAPPAQRFIEGSDLADEMAADLRAFTEYNRWLFLAAAAFADQAPDEEGTLPPLEGQDEGRARPPGGSAYDDFAF